MIENPYKPPRSDISNPHADAPSAFSSLFDLSCARTTKQAVAFYFVYLIGLLFLGFISGVITSGVFGGSNQVAFIVGSILGILCCTGLAVLICVKKSIHKSYQCVGLIILTLISSAIMGALLGLIPISYLTTRERKT